MLGFFTLLSGVGAVLWWSARSSTESVEVGQIDGQSENSRRRIIGISLIAVGILGLGLTLVLAKPWQQGMRGDSSGIGEPASSLNRSLASGLWLTGATPERSVGLYNARIRLFFSLPLQQLTAEALTHVADVSSRGNSVRGTWTVATGWLEFEPEQHCTNSKIPCFSLQQPLIIKLRPDGVLKSVAGNPLTCDADHRCEFTFTTGATFDAIAPSVKLLHPYQDEGINVNDTIDVRVRVSDNIGVSHAQVLIDNQPLGVAVESVFSSSDVRLTIPWSTIGLAVGARPSLAVKVYDLNGNVSTTNSITVRMQPLEPRFCTYSWTFTTKPGLPNGSSCQYNYECSSSFCVGGICVAGPPIIESISPNNGVAANYANTYVTIRGQNFGASQSTSLVRFGAAAAGLGCQRWSNTEIVAQAPTGLANGSLPITISTSAGLSNPEPFTVNSTIHPALCDITPSHGASGLAVTLTGDNLGDTQGRNGLDFTPGPAVKFSRWNDTTIGTEVPDGTHTGDVVATVEGQESNPVTFTMNPYIDRLSPAKGPVGSWVTVIGGNFGPRAGKVVFVGDRATSEDDVEAFVPPVCGLGAWQDHAIVVEVPKGAASGLVQVTTAAYTSAGALTTLPQDSKAFSVNTDPVGPGICRLNPSIGVVGTTVSISGARLGIPSSTNRVTFKKKEANILSWSDRAIQTRVPQVGNGDVIAIRDVVYNVHEECKGVTFRGYCPWGYATVSQHALIESNGLPFVVDSGEGKQCTSDRQCPFGRCVNGTCRRVDNKERCRSDRDCRAGLLCDVTSGQCRPPGCSSNQDCRVGEICDQLLNICLPQCRVRADCPSGFNCSNNRCVLDDTGGGCQRNTDCAVGQYCDTRTHQCRRPTDRGGGGGDGDNPNDCRTGRSCRIGEFCNTLTGRCDDVDDDICTDDAQCRQGQRCDATTHRCVDIRDCRVDTDCPAGHVCNQQTKQCQSLCGNNRLDRGEVCDAGLLSGWTCPKLSVGFTSGVLKCQTDCQNFDTTDCRPAGPKRCGNGVLDPGEVCDHALLNGKVCTDLLPGSTGALQCASDCTGYDAHLCVFTPGVCNRNNIAEGLEQCDGTDLKGKTCQTLSSVFTGGTLGCNLQCHYNIQSCTSLPIGGNVCGDGVVSGGEDCEANVSIATTCQQLGFASGGGPVTCTQCAFNTQQCTGGDLCGNGRVDAANGELCDETDVTGGLVGKTCTNFDDFTGGLLHCQMSGPQRCRLFNFTSCVRDGDPLTRLPTAPRNLAGRGRNRQVTLTWTEPVSSGTKPIIGYRVYRGIVATQLFQVAQIGNQRTYLDRGTETLPLENGVEYFYAVSAVSSVGAGERSATISATPTTLCTDDTDCGPGQRCNPDTHQCTAGAIDHVNIFVTPAALPPPPPTPSSPALRWTVVHSCPAQSLEVNVLIGSFKKQLCKGSSCSTFCSSNGRATTTVSNVLDLTAVANANLLAFLPPTSSRPWTLEVKDTSQFFDTGRITRFEVVNVAGQLCQTPGLPIPTVDAQTVTALTTSCAVAPDAALPTPTPQRSDTFACIGDVCMGDQLPSVAGNQHTYRAEACESATSCTIAAQSTYEWRSVQPRDPLGNPGIVFSSDFGGTVSATSQGNGVSNITVRVRLNLPNTPSAEQSLQVTTEIPGGGGQCNNNNIAEAGEACDGTDLAGKTCQLLNSHFTGGTLRCSNSCGFDVTSCTPPLGQCGNNRAETGEICDGSDLRAQQCTTLSRGFTSGALKCATDCNNFNTSDCRPAGPKRCGDGTIDVGELCDGLNVGGKLCSQVLPGSTGQLKCNDKCTGFDTNQCVVSPNACNRNNIAEGTEQCDGTDVRGKTCTAVDPRLTSGTVKCTPVCQLDTHECSIAPAVCGNSAIEAPEDCDSPEGQALPKTCQSLNFSGGGPVTCTQCAYNTSQCTGGDLCGNGRVEPANGELCDGSDATNGLNLKQCRDFDSFGGGSLGCVMTGSRRCREYDFARCTLEASTLPDLEILTASLDQQVGSTRSILKFSVVNRGQTPVTNDFLASIYLDDQMYRVLSAKKAARSPVLASGDVRLTEYNTTTNANAVISFDREEVLTAASTDTVITTNAVLLPELDAVRRHTVRITIDHYDSFTPLFTRKSGQVNIVDGQNLYRVLQRNQDNFTYRDNAVRESNEANNERTVIVGKPDLVPTSLRRQLTASGDAILSITITNQGAVDVVDDIVSTISVDSVKLQTFRLNPTETNMAFRPLSQPLRSGESITVQVPSTAINLATIHRLRVDVDSLSGAPDESLWVGRGYRHNQVQEQDETNNHLDIQVGGVVDHVELLMPNSIRQACPDINLNAYNPCLHPNTALLVPRTNPTSDSFTCVGKDNCADDVDSVAPGNQHQVILQAYDQQNHPLSARYRLEAEPRENNTVLFNTRVEPADPTPITIIPNASSDVTYETIGRTDAKGDGQVVQGHFATALQIPGRLVITPTFNKGNLNLRLIAEGDGAMAQAGFHAQKVLRITNFPCSYPWPSHPNGFPLRDADDYKLAGGKDMPGPRFGNFSMAYCRDGEPIQEIREVDFGCVGERCDEDDDPSTAGNQHHYRVEALDRNGQSVSEVQFSARLANGVNMANLRIPGVASSDTSQFSGADLLSVTSRGGGTDTLSITATDLRSGFNRATLNGDFQLNVQRDDATRTSWWKGITNRLAVVSPWLARAEQSTPQIPTNVNGVVLPTQITLQWTAPSAPSSPVTNYQILRSEQGGVFKQIDEVSTTQYVDATVRSGVAYTYKVRALSDATEVGTSAPWSANTPAPVARIRLLRLPKLLPDLSKISVNTKVIPVNSATSPKQFKEFFLQEPGAPDVIVVKLFENNDDFSAFRWYYNSVPNPSSKRLPTIKVDCEPRTLFDSRLPVGTDCVEGVQDRNSVYLNSVKSDGYGDWWKVFTNIYFLSIGSNARKELQTINQQLVNNWHFNVVNLTGSEQMKFKRDTKRAADLRDIEQKVEEYVGVHGAPPALTAGTYQRGISYSAWPSWQETLAPELDAPKLPVDPINRFLGCDRLTGFDPVTCWNEQTKVFHCPYGDEKISAPLADGRTDDKDAAYVYAYSVDTQGKAKISGHFEIWGHKEYTFNGGLGRVGYVRRQSKNPENPGNVLIPNGYYVQPGIPADPFNSNQVNFTGQPFMIATMSNVIRSACNTFGVTVNPSKP